MSNQCDQLLDDFWTKMTKNNKRLGRLKILRDRDEKYALVEAGRLPVNEQFFKDNDGESSLVHFEELEEIVVEAEPVIDSQQKKQKI